MGTDIRDIQNAYQGFAKDNFTMLDNLKLGFGGTAGEMARLINEHGELDDSIEVTAETVKDVPFDEMIKAIHNAQNELEITGTTAEEAAETLTGSFSAMKSAAQNVLGKMALGQPIEKELEALGETVSTFLFGNFIPMIANVVKAVPGLIKGIIKGAGKEISKGLNAIFGDGWDSGTIIDQVSKALDNLLGTISERLPEFLEKGGEILGGVGQGILEALPNLAIVLDQLIMALGNFIMESAPAIMEFGKSILSHLGQGIVENLPLLAENISMLVENTFLFLQENLPKLLQLGADFIMWLGQGIVENAPAIGEFIATLVGNILDTITTHLPEIVEKGMEVVVNLAKGVIDNLPAIATAAFETVGKVIETIDQRLPDILAMGWEILNTIVDGIGEVIGNIEDKMWEVIDLAIETIKNRLNDFLQKGREIIEKIVDGIKLQVDSAVQAIKDLVRDMIDAIKQKINDFFNLGRNIVEGVWNGIKAAKDWIVGKVKGFFGGIVDGAKSALGINSPSRVFRDEIGKWIPEGLAVGIDANLRPVEQAVTSMENLLIPTTLNDEKLELTNAMRDFLNLEGLTTNVSHELKQNPQPMQVTFRLGSTDYEAFVNDITLSQNQSIRLTRSYS